MSGKPILHEYAASGNCYKVRLTAAHVGVQLDRREYDILKGETRTPEFLANVNSNGRIPVLQIGDRFIPESNAACIYLADGSALIPSDRFDRADMLRWMFWEQNIHEPNIATVRFWLRYVGIEALSGVQREQIGVKRKAGNEALKLMDEHLGEHDWLVGNRISLADIALYAYTHVAEEGGGFDLGAYPAVGAWIGRLAAAPGYVPIDG